MAAVNGRYTHTLTDHHQPGYDYTATMPDMREMARRMQLQAHAPLEVPQTPPDLGRKILRMKLQPFQQASVANEATLARVRAASGSKPSWTISSRNSGPLQAQDMEPEADDYDEADYTLNPDLDNPPYQSPAVSSAAAPSSTAQPPRAPPALAPLSPSPPLLPVAAAPSDVAATSALLDKLQGEQLTQLRPNQQEAGAVKRKMAAELELVAAERELLRIKSAAAGMLARASAQADEAEEKAKTEAEARAQAKAEADAIREAETRLKAVMPYPFQLADPTKLQPAIEAAKKAGVSGPTIEAAEAKLNEATDKAKKAAEVQARAADEKAARARAEEAKLKVEAAARIKSMDSDGSLQAAFAKLDTNKSGTLNHRELRKALAAVGMTLDSAGAKELLAKYDKDGSGKMDLVSPNPNHTQEIHPNTSPSSNPYPNPNPYPSPNPYPNPNS